MTKMPTGGEVRVPAPYVTDTRYPSYADRAHPVLVAYRNWRSTMSGYPECDGMLAAGNAREFKTLRDFVLQARAGLSNQWSDADNIPGQPWTGNEKRYPQQESQGANGRELIQQLAVNRVGFFGTYHQPSTLYAIDHRRGLMAAVWIYDNHGGLSRARRIAEDLAGSFRP